MKWIHELPGFRKLRQHIRGLHERGFLIPLVLALAVMGVLLHGLLNQEDPGAEADPSEPSPAIIELPTLRPDLEKVPLEYQSDFWRQLGEEVQNKIILIGRNSIPGVVVAPGVMLTSISAADDIAAEQRERQVLREQTQDAEEATTEPETEDPDVPYDLLGVDSEMELALFAVKQGDPDASFQLQKYSILPPGSHIAAVSLAPDTGLIIIPGYATTLSSSLLGDTNENQLKVAIPFRIPYRLRPSWILMSNWPG